MGLFKKLTPFEKYKLYKREDRSAQLCAVKNLYLKAELFRPLNIEDLNFLRNHLLCYLLIYKLKNINIFDYISYIQYLSSINMNFINLCNYIINDFKIYKLVWFNKKNIFFTEKNKTILHNIKKSTISLLNTKLKLVKYEVIVKKNLKIKDDLSTIIMPQKTIIMPQKTIIMPPKTIGNTLKKSKIIKKYIPKNEMVFLKYLNTEEFKKNIFNKIVLNDNINNFSVEDFLKIHIDFTVTVYGLINIDRYFDYLKNLKYEEDKIIFFINLANIYNKIMKNLNVTDYLNFKIIEDIDTINLNFLEIKNLESVKSLFEINYFIDISLKTVIEFVELFLFKFDSILIFPIEQLLQLFYQGIEDQKKFFDFYNLLVNQFNILKFKLNLDTLTFILEFLEFLYLLLDIAGYYPEFFERSMLSVSNLEPFTNLRLFDFNFWLKFKMFNIHNNFLIFDYLFFNYNKNIEVFYSILKSKFFENYLNNEMHIKDIKLCDSKNLNLIVFGFEINKFFSLIEKNLKFFENFNYYIYLKQKYFLKKRKKSKVSVNFVYSIIMITINNIFINFYFLKKFVFLYTLDYLKFVNIFKFKDILIFKELQKKYKAKKNKKYLVQNIDLFKLEVIESSIRLKQIRFNFIQKIREINSTSSKILFDRINFLNLSPGNFPEKSENLLYHILILEENWKNFVLKFKNN